MFGFIGRRIKKTGQKFARWADVPALKKTYSYMHRIGVSVFKPKQETEPPETFEQAMVRMKLTEADLASRARICKLQILFYGLAALGVAIYLAYLIAGGYWLSAGLCLLIMLLLLTCAFKSHFWLFQIKQRKLGCTVQEWLNSSTKESK